MVRVEMFPVSASLIPNVTKKLGELARLGFLPTGGVAIPASDGTMLLVFCLDTSEQASADKGNGHAMAEPEVIPASNEPGPQ
jgi:hypothetical protein